MTGTATRPVWYRQPPLYTAIITGLTVLGDSMLYIVLPTHWEEAGLASLWEVGILLAINRFVRVPVMPLVRRIYAHVPPRPILFAASLLAALSTVAYAFAYGFWEWMAARCLWGLAYAFLRLGGFFTVVKWSDSSTRGFVMGEYDGVFHLGRLVAMLFGGFLADAFGLSAAAVLFGLLSLGAPLLVWLHDPSRLPYLVNAANFSKDAAVWRIARQQPAFLRCALLGCLMNILFQGIFTSSLSHLAESSYGSAIAVGGFVIGAASLSGTLQSLRWAWEPVVSPWIGRITGGAKREPAIAGSLLLCAFAFAVMPLSLPLFWWIAAALVIQMAATFLETLADAAAGDLAAHLGAKTAIMARYTMASDFGAGAGAIFAYLMAGFLSPGASCYLSAAILFLLFLSYRKSM